MTQPETTTEPSRTPVLRWLVLGALILATLVLGFMYLEPFKAWVGTLGAWGPLVFVVGYAVAVVGFVPGAALTLAAGAIFGVVAGTAYVFIAATVGSCAAFLIARYLARAAIEKRIEGNPKFAAVDHAIAGEGLKITFLLRLSPAFPFVLLNYALGLTRVSFADYAIASIGMLPGTLLYVYLGSLAGLAASGSVAGEGGMLRQVFFFGGLVATVLVTVLITRTAKRALDAATAEQE